MVACKFGVTVWNFDIVVITQDLKRLIGGLSEIETVHHIVWSNCEIEFKLAFKLELNTATEMLCRVGVELLTD